MEFKDAKQEDNNLKIEFSDPFQVKIFSTANESKDAFETEFVSSIDLSSKKYKSTNEQAINESTTEDTTYFSTISEQTNDDSQFNSGIDFSNANDCKPVGLQQTIINNTELNEDEFSQQQQEDTIRYFEQATDPFDSNIQIDLFNSNIDAFKSLRDDPFKGEFGSVNENSMFSCKDKSYLKDEDDEFNEQLPANVTYLEPLDSLEQNYEDKISSNTRFLEIDSFERKEEEVNLKEECVLIRKANKLDKIEEDDKEISLDDEIGNEQVNDIEEGELNQADLKWKEKNENCLKLKDEEEEKNRDELKELARKQLEDWFSTYKSDLNLKMNSNRRYEQTLVEEIKKIESSENWKTVVDMCDFNARNVTGHLKDTTRLKSVLLKLKNAKSAS